MKIGTGSLKELPLMAEEEVHLSFGQRHGLQAEAGIDRNAIVLTNRRLIRLSRVGASREVAFISLEDAQVAEVRLTSRGKKPLLRVALLLAGAGAALAAIPLLPVALALAAVLGLGGGYHLLRYISVSQEGFILFRTGQEEVEISFQGDMADQAFAFVNRFFQLKAFLSPAQKAGQEERMEPEALREQGWRGTDEMEIGPVIDQGDGSLVETHEEGFPQEEPERSLELMTMAEAASAFDIPVSTLRSRVARGSLKVHRIGKRTYLLPGDVASWRPPMKRAGPQSPN